MTPLLGVHRKVSCRRVDNGCCDRGFIYGLAANSAKAGFTTIGFAAVRTGRFEPPAARVTKSRVRRILALTLRAKHNGNQSQLSCIVFNSIKPELGVHSERSKQCIVPGYAKSKLKG
jgi:hypothetical protein